MTNTLATLRSSREYLMIIMSCIVLAAMLAHPKAPTRKQPVPKPAPVAQVQP